MASHTRNYFPRVQASVPEEPCGLSQIVLYLPTALGVIHGNTGDRTELSPLSPYLLLLSYSTRRKRFSFPVNVTARQTRIAPCLDSVDLSRAYSYSVIILNVPWTFLLFANRDSVISQSTGTGPMTIASTSARGRGNYRLITLFCLRNGNSNKGRR